MRFAVYDERCPFCRLSMALLLSWDGSGQLEPIAVRSRRADAMLTPLEEEERLASFHLVDPDGTVRSGGDAFPPMLALLPGGRPLARLALRVPAPVRRGYELVSRSRGTLGRAIPAPLRRWSERVIAERTHDDDPVHVPTGRRRASMSE